MSIMNKTYQTVALKHVSSINSSKTFKLYSSLKFLGQRNLYICTCNHFNEL